MLVGQDDSGIKINEGVHEYLDQSCASHELLRQCRDRNSVSATSLHFTSESIRMPNSSISVNVTEIDDSYAFPGFTDEIGQELMNYVTFRQGTHSNYSDTADDDHIQEMMTKSAHYVQHEMPTEVLWPREDYQSILELATR